MKDGGPAFPSEKNEDGEYNKGMTTLRDYFAAKALQGLITKLPFLGKWEGDPEELEMLIEKTHEGLAISSYGYADAMLKAREEAK